MTSPVSRHLLRHWRSVPLSKLHQGSTLVIRSSVHANVVFQPAWRESGHASLEQVFSGSPNNQNGNLVEMVVNQNEPDRMTSIGRLASQVSIDLQPAALSTGADCAPPGSDTATDTATTHTSVSDILHGTTATTSYLVKEIDKVMLDDGTILPDSVAFSPPPAGMRRVDYTDGVAHIRPDTDGNTQNNIHDDQTKATTTTTTTTAYEDHHDSTDALPGTTVTLEIPEKLNIYCHLMQGGSITIAEKVEGDAELYTTAGDIHVKKLRGHRIDLQNHHQQQHDSNSNEISSGMILATSVLEASHLFVKTSGRFRAKQIHGTTVQIQVESSSAATAAAAAASATPPQEASTSLLSRHDVDDEGSLVDISALFVSSGLSGGRSHNDNNGAMIQVQNRNPTRRAVRIKSHHGPVQVTTQNVGRPTEWNLQTKERYPVVELGGVNGNVEVTMSGTRMQQPNDNDDDDDNDEYWNSCLVHVDSLEPETVSVVTADCGNISVTLDRKVEADLRLLSLSTGGSSHGASLLAETTALLAEEADPDMIVNILKHVVEPEKDNISLLDHTSTPTENNRTNTTDSSSNSSTNRIRMATKAFMTQQSVQSPLIQYLDGIVENKSAEPDSRFERKVRGNNATGGSVGKINLDSARNQALHGFVSSSSSNDTATGAEKASLFVRPLLAVIGQGRISVETVSWLGAIARRYGLEEAMAGRRPAGRTAARRGRAFAWEMEDEDDEPRP